MYKSKAFVSWIIVTGAVIPPIISGLSTVFFTVRRYGVSSQWLHRAPNLIFETVCAGWFIWISDSIVLICETLVCAGIINTAIWFHNRSASYSHSLFAIAPAVLMLAIIQNVFVGTVVQTTGLQGSDASAIALTCIVGATSVGLAACTYLVLRIMWDARPSLAMLGAIIVGSMDWWMFPLLLRLVFTAMATM